MNRAAIVLSGCHALKAFAGIVGDTSAYEEPRALCEALFIAPAAFFVSPFTEDFYTPETIRRKQRQPSSSLGCAFDGFAKKNKDIFQRLPEQRAANAFLGGYGFFLCTCNGINLSGGQ